MAKYPLKSPLDAIIEYCNSLGDRSRRSVTIHAITEQSDHLLLAAHCNWRNAPREFRIDRITAFITQDGDVMPPEELTRQLPEFAAASTKLQARTRTEAKHKVSRNFFDCAIALLLFTAGAWLWLRPPGDMLVNLIPSLVFVLAFAMVGLIARLIEDVVARARQHRDDRTRFAMPLVPRRDTVTRPGRTAATRTVWMTGDELTGHRIAFAGQLARMGRNEAIEAVEARGATVTDDISSLPTVVVVGKGSGAEEAKARELAIRTLDERGFRRMLGLNE